MTTTTHPRTQLLDELRRDLVSPHNPDELLTDPPTVQYLTGILYPSGVEIDAAEDDSLGIGGTDEDDEGTTEVVAFSQTMNPGLHRVVVRGS